MKQLWVQSNRIGVISGQRDFYERISHMALLTRRTIIAGSGALMLAGGGAYFGLMRGPENLEPAKVFAVDGIAIRGTDPVAYFTDDQPVIGSKEFSQDWAGATWHFASAQNRDTFRVDPGAYAPQYGGFCAWAVAAKGRLYSTQPKNWTIVDGKLYLNYSDKIQMIWEEDQPGFIKQGDMRWPQLIGDMA
jgi:YHS domain-containing protein